MIISFRFIGDTIHFAVIFGLLLRIYIKKNCSGLSGKTQLVYGIVFVKRSLDIYTASLPWYNIFFKLSLSVITYLTIYLIYFEYKETYQLESDTFYVEALLVLPVPLAIYFNYSTDIIQVLQTYGTFLEVFALFPQFFMIRKIGINLTVGLYICGLAIYRIFYLISWSYEEHQDDLITNWCGFAQFVLYFPCIIFAWNYDHCNMKGRDKLDGYDKLERNETESSLGSVFRKLLRKEDRIITISVVDVPMKNDVFIQSTIHKN